LKTTVFFESAKRMRTPRWQIGNVDSTIIALVTKLASHITAMRERIAQALGVQASQVKKAS
jgi:2-C-methyl-D-erythritol 2,4-cyclodiphosphate synthase